MSNKQPRLLKVEPTVWQKRLSRCKLFAVSHQKLLIVVAIFVIKIGLLGFNIGHYPYVENDEATYVLRASSFADSGKLDYYTYWYDHAPAGWIMMSPFILINSLFGSPISQLLLLRIVMVVLAAISAVLTYLIGVKLFKKRLPALVAVAFLLFSPLTAYYQRRILLDNVMIFWLLLSIYLILNKPHKLRSYALSGIAFGIAVLSKINAAFMVPALWLLIWQVQTHKVIRRHAFVLWTFLMTSVTSLWLLYAQLKGELMPHSAHPETGAFTKISLIDTLKFQAARGGESRLPWDSKSNIYPNAVDWFGRDTLFVGLFVAAFVAALLLVLRKRNRKQLGFILVSICMLGLFMIRGGVVLGFYFLSAAPFCALLLGGVSAKLFSFIKHADFRNTVVAVCIAAIALANIPAVAAQWHQDETSNQIAAVEWIKQNVSDKNAYIISDNYALPYLVSAGYVNTDYQYKVEYDPAINEQKYKKDWRNGDYIIMSHEVLKQIKEGVTPFVKEAFDHSVLVADFRDHSSSYTDTKQYISTNGDWAQVYKIKSDEGIMLQDSWAAYKTNFIKSYGQVLDPATNTTTSYNQAMTMQMAVAEGDKATFDGVWQWTKDHFQNRTQDKLLSSAWGIDKTGKEGLVDTNTTSGANVQAALALLMAQDKWHGDKYGNDAGLLINDIARQETRVLGSLTLQIPYVTQTAPEYLINPSYGDPYAYSRFAKVVPASADFWNKMSADYYSFITAMQATTAIGLVPNWVTVTAAGQIKSATAFVADQGDLYGYESYRIPTILGRAIGVGNDQRAFDALKNFDTFYKAQLGEKRDLGLIYSIYTVGGSPAVNYEDIATNAAALFTFKSLGSYNRNAELEYNKIRGQYNADQKGWGKDITNIRNQQASWMYLSLFYTRM